MLSGGCVITVLMAAVMSCYGHQRSAGPRAVAVRPALPRASAGVYDVQGPAGALGIERFTVTSTGGRWVVRSRRIMPAGEEVFVLELDLETAEPVRFDILRRIDELERRVRGRRVEGWFEVSSDGVGGRSESRLPYAPGTLIDAPTPTFKAVALALLSESLAAGPPVPVRTVRVEGSLLVPRVLLSTFEGRGQRDRLALVRLSRHGAADTGLWAASDGWPVRMRVLGPDRQPRWRWRLRTSTATAASAGSAPR